MKKATLGLTLIFCLGIAGPTPTPTKSSARAIKFGRDTLKGTTKNVAPSPTATTEKQQQKAERDKEVAPTPIANATPPTATEKQISDGKGKMPAYGKEVAPTMTPDDAHHGNSAHASERSINLNSSRSNIRIRPTPTPRKK